MTDEGPVPWLAADERAAWIALSGMLVTMPAAIDAQLKRDSGMNFFEYTILAWLSETPGHRARLTALAQLASGSTSRISHAVSRLEKQGRVVRRTQASGEPRYTEVALTDAGLAAITDAAPKHVREVRRLVFDVLRPAQVGQLFRLARQLLESSAPGNGALLDQVLSEVEEHP